MLKTKKMCVSGINTDSEFDAFLVPQKLGHVQDWKSGEIL